MSIKDKPQLAGNQEAEFADDSSDPRELYSISTSSLQCKRCQQMRKDTCWSVGANLAGDWHKTICCGQFDTKCRELHYCSSSVRHEVLKQMACPVARHRCPSPSQAVLDLRHGVQRRHFDWHEHEMRSEAFCKYRILTDFNASQELVVEFASRAVDAHIVVISKHGHFTDRHAAVAGFKSNGGSRKIIRKPKTLEGHPTEVWIIYEPRKWTAGFVDVKSWVRSQEKEASE